MLPKGGLQPFNPSPGSASVILQFIKTKPRKDLKKLAKTTTNNLFKHLSIKFAMTFLESHRETIFNSMCRKQ